MNGACCDSNAASLVYDPCQKPNPGSDEQHKQRKQRKHTGRLVGTAARALRQSKILVIGDSVVFQWFNALLLDLHGRGLLIGHRPARGNGTAAAATAPLLWTSYMNPPSKQRKRLSSSLAHEPSGFCSDEIDVILEHPEAPHIGFHSLRPDRIPRGQCECCSSTSPLRGKLERVLASFHPDIVVLNHGVHYHDAVIGRGTSYAFEVEQAMHALTQYGERHARYMSPPLLLWLETLPQHFDTPERDGSYDSHQKCKACVARASLDFQGCSAILSTHESVAYGPLAMNRYVRAVMATEANVSKYVRILRAFRPFRPRHDAHWGELKYDCTHYCYAPLLWDSVLHPFYEEVVHWQATVPTSRVQHDPGLRAARSSV